MKVEEGNIYADLREDGLPITIDDYEVEVSLDGASSITHHITIKDTIYDEFTVGECVEVPDSELMEIMFEDVTRGNRSQVFLFQIGETLILGIYPQEELAEELERKYL